MDGLSLFIGLVAGLAIGLGIGFWRVRDIQALTHKVLAEKTTETDKLVQQMKESFSALSSETLSKSTEEFLKLAQERFSRQTEGQTKELDGKKSLIDQTLQAMKGELGKVNEMVQTIEKDRKAKFDVLSDQLTKAAVETKELRQTTHALQSALANSRVRGQWGDRMAEDVLRLAGFVEGINYIKQATLTDAEGKQGRPDYTFYLPQNRVVNMDVKFPLENYLAYLEAENDTEKQNYRQQFLKDSRARIKEAATRSYTAGDKTLDYVIVFIPNEQVYAFVHEHDRDLLDYALNQKVILCSPMTLYAILSVIRQAVDNFHLERTASEILELLHTFSGQWDKFCGAMDKLGEKIHSTEKEFDALTTTRRNMLEKPLRKIDALRDNSEQLFEKDAEPMLKIVQNKD